MNKSNTPMKKKEKRAMKAKGYIWIQEGYYGFRLEPVSGDKDLIKYIISQASKGKRKIKIEIIYAKE